MKSYVFALILAVVAPFMATDAECATKIYRRVNSTKKATAPTTTTFYYNQSNRRKYGTQIEPVKSEMVVKPVEIVETKKVVEPAPASYSEATVMDTYVAKSYNEKKQVQKKTKVSQERKYFLAHPFFQPLKDHFGSITDVAIAKNSFGFDFLNSAVYNQSGTQIALNPTLNLGGKSETSQFLVKQDFSFGLTDQIAIVAMGQYDSTETAFKNWTDGSLENKNTSSGVNIFGFGAQLRFLDVRDSIGMLSVYYESQKDTTDSVLADFKLGYKFDRTTLYLIGRGGYSSFKNKNASYGVYVEENDDYLFLTYKRDVSRLFFGEGGIGLFSVLNKYFTFNTEALFGSYDWHNKLTARAEFGVQPFDAMALGLYVSGTLYDSADGQQKEFILQDVNPTNFSEPVVYHVGNYRIKDYNEYQIGARLILHF